MGSDTDTEPTMTILALNPTDADALATITHIAAAPAPVALDQELVVAAIISVLGKYSALDRGTYQDERVLEDVGHARIYVAKDGSAKVVGKPQGAERTIARIAAGVAAARQSVAAGTHRPQPVAPLAPVRHECLECGATYASAGYVEEGGMGCRRCNG